MWRVYLGFPGAERPAAYATRGIIEGCHESLIAVSNKEFYNNKLVVFPSSVHSAENMGLVFHHLKDTVYDRGNTQTNPEEAKIVAEHVMRHAKEHPS